VRKHGGNQGAGPRRRPQARELRADEPSVDLSCAFVTPTARRSRWGRPKEIVYGIMDDGTKSVQVHRMDASNFPYARVTCCASWGLHEVEDESSQPGRPHGRHQRRPTAAAAAALGAAPGGRSAPGEAAGAVKVRDFRTGLRGLSVVRVLAVGPRKVTGQGREKTSGAATVAITSAPPSVH